MVTFSHTVFSAKIDYLTFQISVFFTNSQNISAIFNLFLSYLSKIFSSVYYDKLTKPVGLPLQSTRAPKAFDSTWTTRHAKHTRKWNPRQKKTSNYPIEKGCSSALETYVEGGNRSSKMADKRGKQLIMKGAANCTVQDVPKSTDIVPIPPVR